MSEALAKVKADLGPSAIILHTRTLKRGGVLGIGARESVEITATADQRVVRARSRSNELAKRTSPKRTFRPASPPSRAVIGELHEIRRMVEEMGGQLPTEPPPPAPRELMEHYTRLIAEDVAQEWAGQIVRRVQARHTRAGAGCYDASGRLVAGGAVEPEAVRRQVVEELTAMLPEPSSPIPVVSGRAAILAFIGPTGVGKTTTIAKLAANFKFREGKRVALLTADTHRIAAVEQLRMYAEALEVPLHVASTPRQIGEALARCRDMDVVMIDTPGRSQRDERRLAELGELLAAARPDEVHLVLTSTGGQKSLQEAVGRFAGLGATHVVFTKLDEAVGIGVLFNVLKSIDLRLSYLTTGQRVPDDIEPGSRRRVAQLILGPEPVPSKKADGGDLREVQPVRASPA